MPVEIDLKLGETVETVGKMIGKLSFAGNVGIARAMNDWQTEDLNRNVARTKKSRWRRGKKSATTVVRAHSRRQIEKSKKYQGKLMRRLRRAKRALKGWVQFRKSTLPVLRPNLYTEFVERTSGVLDAIKW